MNADPHPRLTFRAAHHSQVLQADQRARDHDGEYADMPRESLVCRVNYWLTSGRREYLYPPEVRRAVKRDSLYLLAGIAAFIGLTLLVLFVLRVVLG